MQEISALMQTGSFNIQIYSNLENLFVDLPMQYLKRVLKKTIFFFCSAPKIIDVFGDAPLHCRRKKHWESTSEKLDLL